MFIRHKMKHRDPIALLRSYLRLRSRSPRDSRSFHRPFHPFTVLWTGKPTVLPAPSPPPSFHLYPPLVPRPLFGLKVSLFISLSLALARALERVYARIRFQSLKAGRRTLRTDGRRGKSCEGGAVEARWQLDCRFRAGRGTALAFTWA